MSEKPNKNDDATARPGGTVRLSVVTEKPGDMIGRYKLMEQIGEGGFGAVYVAEQREPVRRWVALKISKLGMDTRAVVARFEAERQALAMMDHPNIAKVLDGGATESGRPYFVMELVRGIKVTDYCDQNKLTTRQRLDLFMQVCRAVQHAHQKGVIHRDIKPSNILVTLHDGVPVPKVIDFGIAKAAQGHLTDKTIYTELQQFMGTPAYMSPEQAEMSGLDVDTRSDLYSLGVLLYELLTGRTPFDGQELLAAGLDEMRRTIREKEPPRPSTRLGSLGGDELTSTAQRHGTEPLRLIKSVRGDLDWIVMKCLEKDRTRRYETANGLAMDIERYLRNDTIVARPPSNVYRFQKLVRRHKLAFAAATAVMASLLIGLGVSSWLLVQERQARQRAAAAEKKALAEAQRADRNAAEEMAERRRANSALANTDFLLAQHLIADGKKADALAYLTRSLSINSSNEAALLRLSDLLTYSSWTVPTVVLQHNDRVNYVEFSPDGKRIVTASADQTARVWDALTGEPLTEPLRHSRRVGVARFTSDGSRILTYSGDAARVWDAQTGRPLLEPLKENNGSVYSQFSPDGNVIVVGYADSTSRLWDVPSGKPLTEAFQHGGALRYVRFSSDGKRFLTGSRDNSARVWDGRTGQPLTEPLKFTNVVRSFRFSPDGNQIVIASGNAAQVLDAQTGQRLIGPLNHLAMVYHARFSPDGSRILTASEDCTARVWDARTGQPVTSPMKHSAPVQSAEFSADGKRIVTASDDNTARIWDAETGQPLTEPMKHNDVVYPASFSPDGKRIVTGSGNAAWVWDAQAGRSFVQPLSELQERTGPANSAEISPDGKKRLAIHFEDNSVRVLDVQTGLPLTAPLKHDAFVTSARFSPDGNWIVTSSMDNTAQVWNAQTGQRLSESLKHNSGVSSARFSPDGKRIVTASWDTTARIWDAQTGQPLTEPLQHPGRSQARADPQTGQPLTEPLQHGNNAVVISAEFSPDGKRIVTAAAGGIVRIWDAQSGEPLTEPWTGYVGGLAIAARFNSEGRRIMFDLDAETTRVTDVPPAAVPCPDWLLALSEALSGEHFGEHGFLEPTKLNRVETLDRIRKKLKSEPVNDDWTVWGRWLLADPATRTISPFSSMTVPEWIERQFTDDSADSLDEVERYAVGVRDAALLQRLAKARQHPVYRLRQALNRMDATQPGKQAAAVLHSVAAGGDGAGVTSWLRQAVEHTGSTPLNDLAWELATASDAPVRNGQWAIICAEQAVAKTHRTNPGFLDTLAAAYGEAGQFDKAVSTQKEAVRLSANNPADNHDFLSRLKLYESQTPYRQPTNSPER